MLPCGIGAEGLNSAAIVPTRRLGVKSSSAGSFLRDFWIRLEREFKCDLPRNTRIDTKETGEEQASSGAFLQVSYPHADYAITSFSFFVFFVCFVVNLPAFQRQTKVPFHFEPVGAYAPRPA
jgi:hypothetical protein